MLSAISCCLLTYIKYLCKYFSKSAIGTSTKILKKWICLENDWRKLYVSFSVSKEYHIGWKVTKMYSKARLNLFLSGFEYSGYVNKLIRTDLVSRTLGHESPPVFSNTCQTNPVSRQYYQTQLSVDSIIKPNFPINFPF